MNAFFFSPRFISAARARKKLLNKLLNPRNSLILTRLADESGIIKQTQSIVYPVPYFFKPFSFSGAELIQDFNTFAIYRERRKNKNAFFVAFDNKNCMRFNYESIPLVLKGRVKNSLLAGVDYECDIIFLSFLLERETIAIISQKDPIYFSVIPFGLVGAGLNKAELFCGLKASVGLELLDTAATSLTFSFQF